MKKLLLDILPFLPIIIIIVGIIFESLGWIKNRAFSRYWGAIIFILFSFGLTAYYCSANHDKIIASQDANIVQEVYICTGKTATTYHKTSSCKGLSRCGGIVEKMNVDDAKKKGRRACKICY